MGTVDTVPLAVLILAALGVSTVVFALGYLLFRHCIQLYRRRNEPNDNPRTEDVESPSPPVPNRNVVIVVENHIHQEPQHMEEQHYTDREMDHARLNRVHGDEESEGEIELREMRRTLAMLKIAAMVDTAGARCDTTEIGWTGRAGVSSPVGPDQAPRKVARVYKANLTQCSPPDSPPASLMYERIRDDNQSESVDASKHWNHAIISPLQLDRQHQHQQHMGNHLQSNLQHELPLPSDPALLTGPRRLQMDRQVLQSHDSGSSALAPRSRKFAGSHNNPTPFPMISPVSLPGPASSPPPSTTPIISDLPLVIPWRPIGRENSANIPLSSHVEQRARLRRCRRRLPPPVAVTSPRPSYPPGYERAVVIETAGYNGRYSGGEFCLDYPESESGVSAGSGGVALLQPARIPGGQLVPSSSEGSLTLRPWNLVGERGAGEDEGEAYAMPGSGTFYTSSSTVSEARFRGNTMPHDMAYHVDLLDVSLTPEGQGGEASSIYATPGEVI